MTIGGDILSEISEEFLTEETFHSVRLDRDKCRGCTKRIKNCHNRGKEFPRFQLRMRPASLSKVCAAQDQSSDSTSLARRTWSPEVTILSSVVVTT